MLKERLCYRTSRQFRLVYGASDIPPTAGLTPPRDTSAASILRRLRNLKGPALRNAGINHEKLDVEVTRAKSSTSK